MAKIVHDDVLDGALNIIKNNCTRMVACSAQPTTYTEGNATYALADVTMASTTSPTPTAIPLVARRLSRPSLAC